METSSRRRFIVSVGLMYGSFYARESWAKALPAKREVLLITNSIKTGYGKPWMTVQTPPSSLRVHNLFDGKTEEIALPFFGHTLEQSPHQHSVAATFEQFGRRGAIVDLRNRKILGEVKTKEGNTFIGHAAYSPDGKLIYTVEHNHPAKNGEVSIRDSTTLKHIQTMSSFGLVPHDCRVIDSGRQLVVANNAGPGNISYIELSSGKLLNQIRSDRDLVLSHFDISSDQWLFAAPRTKSPFGLLVSPKGEQFKLAHPEIDETGILSAVFVKGTDLLAATYPEGNCVQVWNYKSQQPVGSISLPNPRGILSGPRLSAGESSLIVSLAEARVLKSLTVTKNKVISSGTFEPGFGGSGSHLVRMSL